VTESSNHNRRHPAAATVLVVVGLLALPGTATAAPQPDCSDQGWLGVWSAAPSDASRGSDSLDQFDLSMNPKSAIRNGTVRAILTPTFGGTTARVRLSNRFGTAPATFAQASIARRDSQAALMSGTIAPLTFHGLREVTVAPGNDVLSDPVEISFQEFDPLAVSIYVAGEIGYPKVSFAPSSVHLLIDVKKRRARRAHMSS